MTIPSTVIPITVAAFAAYAFAWMRFPFRRTLFLIVVALLVVPLQMALIPVLRALPAISGSTNSFLGRLAGAHRRSACRWPIFLLYNFISQLPGDLFETASIDGATHFQMFTTRRAAAVGAGARGVRDLPVPVGLERPARGARVPERAGRRSRS